MKVVTLPQKRLPQRKRLVLQETLLGILESQSLVDEAKAQVLKELEAGAEIEPGYHRARIKKSIKGGRIIRTLLVR